MSAPAVDRVDSDPSSHRARLIAVLLTSILVCARLAQRPPLVTWSGDTTATGVSLERGGLRLLLSPIVSVLEQWSLLTIPDHVAVLGSVLLLGGVIQACRASHRQVSRRDRAVAGLVGSVQVGAVTLAIAGAGALFPWPMASLHHDDPDEVSVDFHSHTDRSHDGRWDFDRDANRDWHRDGGFDVAYITDHADSARASMNVRADGARPIMLNGAEFRSGGAHVVRLGQPNDRESVLILTTPFASGAPETFLTSHTSIAGVEVADASPRGLQFLVDTPGRLSGVAHLLHALPVASSNLHGWGRTAAAWTLLRLPGWQQDSPTRLDARIRSLLRSADSAASTIVLRRAVHTSASDRAFILPLIYWTTMQTLDDDEVWIWLLWIWIPALAPELVRSMQRYRRPIGASRVTIPTRAPTLVSVRRPASLLSARRALSLRSDPPGRTQPRAASR